METDRTHRARRVSIWAHPLLSSLLYVALCALGIVFLRDESSTPQDVRNSILLGLVSGLPMGMVAKYQTRKHVDYYAEIYTTPWAMRKTSRHFVLSLPAVAHLSLFGLLRIILHIRETVGIFAGFALYVVILYPEQKAIYDAAKARLASNTQ